MKTTKYDYIVVGAGSAGCVLANRLTEQNNNSVCVLEAGPEDKTPFIKIPGAFAYFMFSKKYNWAFSAEPVSDIRNGDPLFCPRGKTLGGSSAINAMVYIRGHKSDYDAWESLGNDGWGYQKMLPYFKKSETNERGGCDFHGDKGPLFVSDCRNHYALNNVFIDAAKQAGFPITEDFNGSQFEGAGYFQFTIQEGERCGVSQAYLKPARPRRNLNVECEAVVTRVLFDGKQAIGVEYRQRGQLHKIYAEQEVILSGGAFNSPQLLMLSGIGDKQELKDVGINAIHNLPGVGKNLQEHVDACVLQESRQKDGFTTSMGGLLKMVPDTMSYFSNKTGKLASSITQAGAFLKSSDDVDVPDIQMHFVPLLFDDSGRDLRLMSRHGYSCHVCVLRPKSRGAVKLRSSDPLDSPKIDFNFFDHEDDRKTLVNGIRQARKILAAKSFDSYRGEEIHPGTDVVSEEAILEKCKERLGLVFHPVGTCKMGHDEQSVVDDHLRVHGIEGLRVVDASIMPTLISGNTNAPVIAIAEKAADLILADSSQKLSFSTALSL